jgi:hypothetical protein
MRSTGLLVLSAAVAFTGTVTPVVAQIDNDAEVRGTVVSAETGEPVAGAWVALADREFGTYSHRDGRFILRDMPDVPRGYFVAALGYEPSTVTLDPTADQLVVELAPDEAMQPGLAFLLDHLDERRNGARVFDREALTYSNAFNLGELLNDRGVRGVRRVCLDERWAPGLLVESPVGLYRMEIHGQTARVYTEAFLERMATKDEATIRRSVRPELPKC